MLQAIRTSANCRSRSSVPASSSARFSSRYDSSSSTPPAFQIGIAAQHRHGKAEQEPRSKQCVGMWFGHDVRIG